MLRLVGYKIRRLILVFVALGGVVTWLVVNPNSYEENFTKVEDVNASIKLGEGEVRAVDILERLEVKGRSPKTGYDREEFYKSWPTVDGCNLRQKIIRREFGSTAVLDGCTVLSGEYDEPYTGEHIIYSSKDEISSGIQIDHVVALSDAWQKGADFDHMTAEKRRELATDPLNLLAVDSKANQSKSDGDAATWLPKNKKFRCQYVARQVSVKYKYNLWVTEAEKDAIKSVLENCPNELAVGVSL